MDETLAFAKPTPLDDTIDVEDWEEAQEHANFLLLRSKAKAGWRTHTETLRGESKTHYSSLRIIQERAGVKFRLKQTLNDWWVPVSNEFNLKKVEGHFFIGDEVVLTGRDYHGRPGACAQIFGTTVEMFLLEGMPTAHHWVDALAQLEPAVPEAVAEARKSTFAERSYWNRWKRDTGPWDSHEFTRPQWMRPNPDTIAKVAWASTPDQWAPMPGAPESIASLEKKGLREMQVLFRQPMTLNYTSWLRVTDPVDPEGPIGKRDPRYPQKWESSEVSKRKVEWSALCDAGPWFFYWVEKNRSYELHLRGSKALDDEKALRILASVIG